MAEACRAFVATGPTRGALADVALPDDLRGGGLLAVEAAGLCGSDVPLWDDHPLGRRLRPLIIGHETVGRLEQGDDALLERSGARPGDLVLVEEFVPCGTCPSCRSGRSHVCPATDYHRPTFLRYGRTPLSVAPGLWGGLAERLYLHPRVVLHRVPEGLDPATAVLAVPLANGLRWVGEVGRAGPGDSVVVLGPGAHGLGCVLAARALGATTVVACGLAGDGRRLEVAKALGADETVVVPRGGDRAWAGRLAASLGGGATVVVDVTAGADDALAAAVALAGDGGRVVVAGGKGPAPERDFPGAEIVRKELSLHGVRGHRSRDLAAALGLAASHAERLRLLTTHTFPLERAEEALRLLAGGSGGASIHISVGPGAA